MADLSRVLQALGAILQGGGSTITAIDEDRRRRELDERNSAYLDSIMQSQEAARNRQAFDDRMAGIQQVPEGGLPPLGALSVPNPMGSGPAMDLGGRPDPRVVVGNQFIDPTQASPNEMMASAANRRAVVEVGRQFAATLAQDSEFMALKPEQQARISRLVETGVIDVGGALNMIAQNKGENLDAVNQDFFYEAGKKMAASMRMPMPPDVDGRPAPGFNYEGFYNVLFNGQLQQRLAAMSGGGGGGLTAGQAFDRTVMEAGGEALILALEGKSIQQIAAGLATKGYGSLENGIRIQIARDVFESVRQEGDSGSLLDMQPRASFFDELSGGGGGGAAGPSQAQRLLSGSPTPSDSMNRTVGEDLTGIVRGAGSALRRTPTVPFNPLDPRNK